MKQFILSSLFCFLSVVCLISQSQTFEIVPEFRSDEIGFITSEFEFAESKESTEFIGLSCYHFDKNQKYIFYRLKVENHWTEWIQFDLQHEFVEATRKAYQTAPIEKAFSSIQFRTTEMLNSALTIRFFVATHSDQPTSIVQRSVLCELPEVCERICWCPTCPIDVTPAFTTPTHLIVHHSAGSNQSSNFATVVEYIWDLHVNTNGWDDIGYNWLIDPNGVLYQGRPDGYQGAHFSCINENTVGICVIGNYTSVQPTQSALSTLVSLLAYEATEHEIDITEESYHVTGDFVLENVAGHRDSAGSDNACSSTVCPGDSFYPLLSDLKTQVTELPCYGTVSKTDSENTISDISVYPNPFNQSLYISSEEDRDLTLQIVDITGRKVGTVKTGMTNDLSHLKTGSYFLSNKGYVIQKIVKQ